jgi:hypothetical protein
MRARKPNARQLIRNVTDFAGKTERTTRAVLSRKKIGIYAQTISAIVQGDLRKGLEGNAGEFVTALMEKGMSSGAARRYWQNSHDFLDMNQQDGKGSLRYAARRGWEEVVGWFDSRKIVTEASLAREIGRRDTH